MKKNIIHKIILMILFITTMCFLDGSIDVNASESIRQNNFTKSRGGIGYSFNETFPDKVLASELANQLVDGDVDAVITQDMIDDFTEFKCVNSEIEDISGLEVFSNLWRITIENSSLKYAKISGFKHLERLLIYKNSKLENIIIEDTPVLKNLYLQQNKLQSIDLSKIVSLEILWIWQNELTSIGLDNLTNLSILYLQDNQLTSLPSALSSLNKLYALRLENNLLPTNYQDVINELELPRLQQINTPEKQDKLIMKNTNIVIDVSNIDIINGLNLYSFVKLESNRELSNLQKLILTNYVDENNNPVNISDYINNKSVIKNGEIFAQIRATGEGLYQNNSDNVITVEKLQFNFIKQDQSFKVTFDLNGATGSIPSQNILENTLITKPTNPVRAGYTFKGWNTKKDGSGINWNFIQDKMPASDLVLYANWQLNDQGSDIPDTGSNAIKTVMIISALGLISILGVVSFKKIKL